MYGRYTEELNDLSAYGKKHARKLRKRIDPNENPLKIYSKNVWGWRFMRK